MCRFSSEREKRMIVTNVLNLEQIKKKKKKIKQNNRKMSQGHLSVEKSRAIKQMDSHLDVDKQIAA